MKTRLLKRLRKYAKRSIYFRIYEDTDIYAIYNRKRDTWYFIFDRYRTPTFEDLIAAKSALKMRRIMFILDIVKIEKMKRDLNKYNNE